MLLWYESLRGVTDGGEQVYDHYRRHWGAPARQASFSRESGSVLVLKWSPESTGLGVPIYATLGGYTACDRQGHRTEYILGLDPEVDDVASTLASLALYSREFRTEVDDGHTVPSDRPLWPRSTMSAFLVLRQRQTIIAPIALLDGTHADFLMAVPISESERKIKATRGLPNLLDLWDQCGIDFGDSNRPTLERGDGTTFAVHSRPCAKSPSTSPRVVM